MPRGFLEGSASKSHMYNIWRTCSSTPFQPTDTFYDFDKSGSHLHVPQAWGLDSCRTPAAKGFVLIEFMVKKKKKPNIYYVKWVCVWAAILMKLCRKNIPAQADRLFTLIASKPQWGPFPQHPKRTIVTTRDQLHRLSEHICSISPPISRCHPAERRALDPGLQQVQIPVMPGCVWMLLCLH